MKVVNEVARTDFCLILTFPYLVKKFVFAVVFGQL